MSQRLSILARPFGVMMIVLTALVFAPAAGAAPYLGPDDGPIRLMSSSTVTGDSIRLGDLFSGHPIGEEKVIAQAPAPGEHVVLEAAWLEKIADTYGIDWQPKDAYDRAVVTRAARTITPTDILAAFKTELVNQGMSTQIGLRAGAQLPTLVVPLEASMPFTVREATYDAATRTFTAIGEFPGPDGKSQFLKVRGTGYDILMVPVLKADAARPKVITADMIQTVEVADNAVRRDTIVDADSLIGKSPKTFIRAGQPIRTDEVTRLTLVDVPVLRSDMKRDDVISENNLTWATMSATELPADTVTTMAYLIGKSPRHEVAANAPIRRGDVLAAHAVNMAVAARDLPNGEPLTADNISWVPNSDDTVGFGVIINGDDIAGRVTTHPIRAGQPLHTVDVKRPTLIAKDKLITIIYSTPIMKLTVRGTAMENGGAHETIRVANANSKTVVLAEVLDADTVRVVSQQTAMR